MREAVRSEQGRLEVEALQIEDALAIQARRNRGKSGGGNRLSRAQVLDVVERAERPLTAAEVQAFLSADGLNASLNAVRNHLARLEENDRRIVRTPDGRFVFHPRFGIARPNEPPEDEAHTL